MKAVESNDFSGCVDQIAAEDDIQSVIVLADRNTEPGHGDEQERHRIEDCEASDDVLRVFLAGGGRRHVAYVRYVRRDAFGEASSASMRSAR